MSSSNFKTLKISEIEPSYNSRSVDEDLSDLMRSIKEQGLLEPIGVVKEKKTYRIAYGNRRYYACKKLGHKFIECIIQQYSEEKYEVIANAAENIQRKQLNPYEKGMQVNHLITNYGLTKNEVSASLGLSIVAINNFLAMYQDLPKQYRNDISTVQGNQKNGAINKIPTHTANRILQASKTHNLSNEQKCEMLDLAKQGKIKIETVSKIASILKKGMTVMEAINSKNMYALHAKVVVSESDYRTVLKSGLSHTKYLEKVIFGELPPLKDKDFIKKGK